MTVLPFGIAFDGFTPVRDAVDVAKQAEALGAQSFWIAEHLGYRECFVTATALALATERARLVPTAISPYLRHPTTTAMALASLAELAPGRAAVAVGAGNPMFLAESGHELRRPVEAIEGFVKALAALYTTQPVHQQSSTFRLAGARVAFAAGSAIPTYVAAMGPQMLKLSGRIADGVVLSSGLSPEYSAIQLALACEGARAAGRDPATLRKASYVYFMADTGGNDARRKVREKLAFLFRNSKIADNLAHSGLAIDQPAIMAAVARRDLAAAAALVPDQAIDRFAICGDAATCRRRLDAYLGAGLEEVVLSLVGTLDDRKGSLALLGRL